MSLTRIDAAMELFRRDFNCAQAVAVAFADVFPGGAEEAVRLACGFGGGLGRAQETCGAVAGGVLVLGARHGRGLDDPKSRTEETYACVRCLLSSFVGHHGSCRCRDLLDGCDINTEVGQLAYRAAGYRAGRCEEFIREVVAAVEAMEVG
ncbi:MAG: C_GCAxxG_C_C family protein [Opitutaceae bacterium]|nr:C_GCAxxG_C_C family protein [Opitutaceae bacterium]